MEKRKRSCLKLLLERPKVCLLSTLSGREEGWLVVLWLTALLENISVSIGPFPKEREKEEKKD